MRKLTRRPQVMTSPFTTWKETTLAGSFSARQPAALHIIVRVAAATSGTISSLGGRQYASSDSKTMP